MHPPSITSGVSMGWLLNDMTNADGKFPTLGELQRRRDNVNALCMRLDRLEGGGADGKKICGPSSPKKKRH
jgi:hypothetical protein